MQWEKTFQNGRKFLRIPLRVVWIKSPLEKPKSCTVRTNVPKNFIFGCGAVKIYSKSLDCGAVLFSLKRNTIYIDLIRRRKLGRTDLRWCSIIVAFSSIVLSKLVVELERQLFYITKVFQSRTDLVCRLEVAQIERLNVTEGLVLVEITGRLPLKEIQTKRSNLSPVQMLQHHRNEQSSSLLMWTGRPFAFILRRIWSETIFTASFNVRYLDASKITSHDSRLRCWKLNENYSDRPL